MDQGNICSQIIPMHRKAGIRLLSVKGFLHNREGVTPMDANRVAWNIGGGKKGEPHDMIPMHMGHEKVIHLRFAWTVLAHDLLPETAQPRAHIAYGVLCAAHEVHTGGVAPVAVPDRESEFRVD